jgi:hypothetical protein
VSPVVGEVVIDACTLWNFAVVGRLDLLDGRYSHRGVRWTESIQLEIKRHVREEPQLQDVLTRVLAECHAAGEIGCPDAFDLLKAMAAKGRGVRIPPSHRNVCP